MKLYFFGVAIKDAGDVLLRFATFLVVSEVMSCCFSFQLLVATTLDSQDCSEGLRALAEVGNWRNSSRNLIDIELLTSRDSDKMSTWEF